MSDNTDNVILKKIIHEVKDSNGFTLCEVLDANGQEKFMYLDVDDVADAVTSQESLELENNTETKFEWGDTDSRLLLDLYGQYLSQIGPMKKFKNKKKMWQQISNDISEVMNVLRTPMQCENRYKTILKRKSLGSINNKQSGSSRVEVPFEEELEKIKSIDDSVEPEIIMDAHTKEVKNKRAAVDEEKKTKKIKKNSVELVSILKELHTEKEKNKQIRHQEKLNLLREIFGKNIDKEKIE